MPVGRGLMTKIGGGVAGVVNSGRLEERLGALRMPILLDCFFDSSRFRLARGPAFNARAHDPKKSGRSGLRYRCHRHPGRPHERGRGADGADGARGRCHAVAIACCAAQGAGRRCARARPGARRLRPAAAGGGAGTGLPVDRPHGPPALSVARHHARDHDRAEPPGAGRRCAQGAGRREGGFVPGADRPAGRGAAPAGDGRHDAAAADPDPVGLGGRGRGARSRSGFSMAGARTPGPTGGPSSTS